MATSGSHGEFKPAGPTHDMTYEPDQFSVKPILAVPAVVIFTATLAFVTSWLLLANIFDPRVKEPADFPETAERNNASLNERFSRTSSSDPKAEFVQPRLEGLQVTEEIPSPGGQYTITSQFTTTKPLKEGNSPRYHAEDLRPEKMPQLQVKDKDRMPIDEAISELVSGGYLKARPGATQMDVNSEWDRPKESNGGTGKPPESPQAPKEPEKPKK